ncbi:MAG TPA: hypothetical protein ENK24_06735 [Anaerolineae bacterium]|nr:hypothetical protein [Anaerolineae bacterium]
MKQKIALNKIRKEVTPLTIEGLTEWTAKTFNRVIKVIEVELPPPVSGFWFTFRGVEIIAIADDQTPLLKTRARLHELAHIILGHQSMVIGLREHLKLRGQSSIPAGAALFRGGDDETIDDAAAERLANEIQTLMSPAPLPTRSTVDAGQEYLEGLFGND